MNREPPRALILAGGAGERFWPLSRRDRPKQFLELLDGRTLIRQTFERAQALAGSHGVWVTAAEQLVRGLRAELPEVSEEHIVRESVGRDTCPAVALGCHLIARESPEACVVVLPSDHWIPDQAPWLATLERAVAVARRAGGLVTLGITPHRPETGYGYIERGPALEGWDGVRSAVRFHEKPDLPAAREYLASGGFLWNSGIFVWTARAFLGELERQRPEIARALPPARVLSDPKRRQSAIDTFFREAPSISVDHGIMEGAERVWVVEASFMWSDLGSWEAWGEILPPDRDGNRTQGDAVLLDAHRNIVCAGEGGRVALLGCDGLVVVHTPDATLVCPRERVQEIRDLVRGMRERDHEDRFL